MPRATDCPTTSRRVFIGATTIGLLAGAPIAALAAVPGEHPDAELMALCEAFQACQARVDVLNNNGLDEDTMTQELLAWDSMVDDLGSMTPETPEGLGAQAAAAITALKIARGVSQYDSWEDRAGIEDRLVMAVLERVAGRA